MQALKILKKIPESALERLGMHAKVALPEALIIECVPVPPNCTRIQDDIFGSSNIGFKQGVSCCDQLLELIMKLHYQLAGFFPVNAPKMR